MQRSRRVVIGAAGATILILALAGVAVSAVFGNARQPPYGAAAGGPAGYGYGMMGSGGSGMGPGGGYGMMGGTGASIGSRSGSGAAKARGSQALTLVVRSDAEHALRGSDGNWHDAFLPADFTVQARRRVTVTVYNYDDMPHSFTSSALGVDATIPAGSESSPSKTTFAFTAPATTGSYAWWCALPCDSWAMVHDGYMRGHVTVRA